MATALNYEREVLILENGIGHAEYIESVTILLKILNNVIREPQNEKYRTIRLENKIIKEKLLCLTGVRELLKKIGFVEVTCIFHVRFFVSVFVNVCMYCQVNGTLNLPTNVLIATIRKYRDQLNDRYELIKNGTSDEPMPQSPSQAQAISAKPSGSRASTIKPRPTKIIPLKSYSKRTAFDKVVVSVIIGTFWYEL